MDGNGFVETDLGIKEPVLSSSPLSTEQKPSKRPLISYFTNKIRGVFRENRNKSQEQIQLNSTANSHITPEMEDQKLLHQVEQVELLEKEIALLQEEVQQSTIPSLNKFPPEFKDSLAKDEEDFNHFMSKMLKKEQLPASQDIFSWKIPYHLSRGVMYHQIPSDPKEYVLSSISKARQFFQFAQRSGNEGRKNTASYYLKNAIRVAKSSLISEKEAVEVTSELKTGDHYLSHGVFTKSIGNVFESGYISSIQSQLERFGKAHIQTFDREGFATEYPDRLDLGWRGVIRKNENSEYEDIEMRVVGGKTKRERYEILFNQDSLYYSLSTVNFIFPAAELLQDGSWFEHDGLHLFNQDYDPKNKREGYEISLKDRPHLIVTSVENRDQILKSIEEAGWIEDKEAYVRNNVVFMDDEKRNGRHISEKIRVLAKEKFKNLDYSQLGSHIVPTGAVLDSQESVFGAGDKVYLAKRA